MAFSAIGGGRAMWGWNPFFHRQPPAHVNMTIAATGEKAAFLGMFYHKDLLAAGGTKDIQRVQILWGSAITKAGGSALTLSLQDVSVAAGSPGRPDETQDQTVAIPNADISASTWYRTGTLSANRAVSAGDLFAMVIEYDGSGRLSSDSITLAMNGIIGTSSNFGFGTSMVKTGGSWAAANHTPNVVFECSDGTFGTFVATCPVSAWNTHSFKQDTASADEYAMAVQVSSPVWCDGMFICVGAAFNTNFNLIFYTGTTATETKAVDGHSVLYGSNTNNPLWVPFSQARQLVPGTQYYIAVQPTGTTANLNVYSADVNAAGHLDCWPGGQNWTFSTRVDSGSWDAATTTRRLLAGLSIAGVDSGGEPGNLSGGIFQ